MTIEEFGQIAKALRHYYPRESLMPNQEAVALWYDELQDLDAKAVKAALRKWVATNKWSPSIAEIRESVVEFTTPKIKDWSEAFEDARQAIRRYGSYNPQEAMESLDDLTRETVKRMGYHDMCMSENHAADRANFRMIYETLAKREREDRQVTPDVRLFINAITNTLAGNLSIKNNQRIEEAEAEPDEPAEMEGSCVEKLREYFEGLKNLEAENEA